MDGQGLEVAQLTLCQPDLDALVSDAIVHDDGELVAELGPDARVERRGNRTRRLVHGGHRLLRRRYSTLLTGEMKMLPLWRRRRIAPMLEWLWRVLIPVLVVGVAVDAAMPAAEEAVEQLEGGAYGADE